MEYLVGALPVWDEGGPAAVGASQRKFAAGVDNVYVLYWFHGG